MPRFPPTPSAATARDACCYRVSIPIRPARTAARTTQTLDQPARPGSVLETIDATIGGVPRALLRDTAVGDEPSPIVRPVQRR